VVVEVEMKAHLRQHQLVHLAVLVAAINGMRGVGHLGRERLIKVLLAAQIIQMFLGAEVVLVRLELLAQEPLVAPVDKVFIPI